MTHEGFRKVSAIPCVSGSLAGVGGPVSGQPNPNGTMRGQFSNVILMPSTHCDRPVSPGLIGHSKKLCVAASEKLVELCSSSEHIEKCARISTLKWQSVVERTRPNVDDTENVTAKHGKSRVQCHGVVTDHVG